MVILIICLTCFVLFQHYREQLQCSVVLVSDKSKTTITDHNLQGIDLETNDDNNNNNQQQQESTIRYAVAVTDTVNSWNAFQVSLVYFCLFVVLL